jgi:hypothetical protein
MSAKTLQSSISVLITGQLSKISAKIDRYHTEVKTGFTQELRQTIDVMHIERRETMIRHDTALACLKQELRDREKTLSNTSIIIRNLEIKEGMHLVTEQRLSDLELRWESQSQDLNSSRQNCLELQSQIPFLKQSLSDKAQALTEMTAEQARLRMSHISLKQELTTSQQTCMALEAKLPCAEQALACATTLVKTMTQTVDKFKAEHQSLIASSASLKEDRDRLKIANDMLPKLQETSRWFHHFLPNIDIDELTSLPAIGHAQEIATHSLLKNIFGDQFYAIDLVSNERHSTDIRIQAEKSGPIVLVEVKTYIPSSKGIVRNGINIHQVPNSGRQKLIDDLGHHRLNGCLAGIMILHKNQYVPNIPILNEDSIIVDPEHSHIFYAQHSSAHIRKTVVAAVLYAYAIWGKNRASDDYEGRIVSLTRLITAKNIDALTALSGIYRHVDEFGKQHKLRTSEAAAIGINLRSIKEAMADAKRATKPASTHRKRSRHALQL